MYLNSVHGNREEPTEGMFFYCFFSHESQDALFRQRWYRDSADRHSMTFHPCRCDQGCDSRPLAGPLMLFSRFVLAVLPSLAYFSLNELVCPIVDTETYPFFFLSFLRCMQGTSQRHMLWFSRFH
jgi:hypothetical protein